MGGRASGDRLRRVPDGHALRQRPAWEEWSAHGVFTLFAILFLFIGAQFLAFGLLGEYIGRIYQEVRERPTYLLRNEGDRRPHRRKVIMEKRVLAGLLALFVVAYLAPLGARPLFQPDELRYAEIPREMLPAATGSCRGSTACGTSRSRSRLLADRRGDGALRREPLRRPAAGGAFRRPDRPVALPARPAIPPP